MNRQIHEGRCVWQFLEVEQTYLESTGGEPTESLFLKDPSDPDISREPQTIA